MLQADVDALAAALDEAVRVEDDRRAGREVDDGLGVDRQVADAERRRHALEQPRRPRGPGEQRRRVPGVDEAQPAESGSMTA